MENLGYICGFLCVLLIVGLVGLFVWGYATERKQRGYTEENGDKTIGWLLQANDNLYKTGGADYPAFVLVSPDPETANDEAFMTKLSARIMALKEDGGTTDDEELVSEYMNDETYVYGRRERVPKSLSSGRKVYMVHIWIYREHLPKKRLTEPFVYCQIVWDEPKTQIQTCPYPRNKKRRRVDDEDDD